MNTKKTINPIRPGSIAKWTLIALVCGGVGLQIVHLKNQQFQLGQDIRQVEQTIREVRVNNEVLLAEIATLSSRTAIQKKLASYAIQMTPIQDQYIARIATPEIAQGDSGMLRTAATERFRR